MCLFIMVFYVSCVFLWICCFFFFKQKTAYEMRISAWSSDVCSSDLHIVLRLIAVAVMRVRIDPQARHARAAHCIGQAGLRVSDEVKLLAGVKAGFGDGEIANDIDARSSNTRRRRYGCGRRA